MMISSKTIWKVPHFVAAVLGLVSAAVSITGFVETWLANSGIKQLSQIIDDRVRQMNLQTQLFAYYPLTTTRQVKKELNVYFNPSQVSETETGWFVPIVDGDGSESRTSE